MPLALITGASGTVGRRALSALRDDGWRTRALSHHSVVVGADEVVPGDLRSGEGLDAAVDGTNAVLHLAAVTHARRAEDYDAVNHQGTRALVAAAERRGAGRFVLVSTRAIDPSGGAYSASKARAEQAIRELSGEWVVVRLPELYGGGREGVDRIIRSASAGLPIPLVGPDSAEVCPIHVDDGVAALVAAMRSGAAARRVYTLAGSCSSQREFANACRTAFRSKSRIVTVPAPLVGVLSWLARVVPLPLYPDQLARLRSEKPPPSPEARRDLGFCPRGLTEGLRSLSAPALRKEQH